MTTPTIRSRRSLVVAAALVAALFMTSCLSAEQQSTLDLTNAARRSMKLGSLSTHQLAQKKAQAWAEKMAREKKMYHSSLADGMGNCWWSLGENVGYGPSIASVHAAWMNSPGHRANILGNKYTGIGIGVAKSSDGLFYMSQVFVQSC